MTMMGQSSAHGRLPSSMSRLVRSCRLHLGWPLALVQAGPRGGCSGFRRGYAEETKLARTPVGGQGRVQRAVDKVLLDMLEVQRKMGLRKVGMIDVLHLRDTRVFQRPCRGRWVDW